MRQPRTVDYAFSKLLCYVAAQFPQYRIGNHHKIIANKLQAVERGDILRLVITVPPRHGKSLLASEYFPAWYLGRNPDRYVIAASYGQELASDFGRKVRNQLTDQTFKAIFPNCTISSDSQSSSRFNTIQGGAYFAVGVGGSVTGRGAHLLLIDDPVKNREEAESEVIRKKVVDWFTSTAYTRLMPYGAIVVIQTRWHEDDLTGWILQNSDEEWEVVNLPAISDSGEPLWAEQYPLERLLEIKATIGSRDWSALYQQKPTPEEGNIFKKDWVKRYHSTAIEPFMKVHSWDTAYKKGEHNDPSCMTCWEIGPNGFYMMDCVADRMEYPELKQMVIDLANRDKPDAILIEDKASGQSLIHELQNYLNYNIIPIKPDSDKETRARVASASFEAGKIYLPAKADWLADLEHELYGFPNTKHDDRVDSISQFIIWARDNARRANRLTYSQMMKIYRDAR